MININFKPITWKSKTLFYFIYLFFWGWGVGGGVFVFDGFFFGGGVLVWGVFDFYHWQTRINKQKYSDYQFFFIISVWT